jgi:D-serine deaminase-like pyridoxal phosphate-dependent protein
VRTLLSNTIIEELNNKSINMDITSPTLLLDKEKCLANIKFMADKAKRHNLKFRPHFKTHASAEVGSWFRDFGVTAITVSSVKMAKYFSDNGWSDITIAFPVNPLEIDAINELAAKINLNLITESKSMLQFLGEHLRQPVGVFLEIDAGYGRTGVPSDNENKIESHLEYFVFYKGIIRFKGFLAHAGNTYKAKTRHGISNIHFESMLKLKRLKKIFKPVWPDLEISIGDTPSCSICEDFKEVDEIRPGNFIFYDITQQKLGSCKLDQIALRMVCPVVSKHLPKNLIFIHGGATHFSKDYYINIDGKPLFGRIIRREGDKRILLNEMNYLNDLSHEHGQIKISPKEYHNFKIGDLIEVLPVHACLAVHAMGWYMTTEGQIIKTMPAIYRT